MSRRSKRRRQWARLTRRYVWHGSTFPTWHKSEALIALPSTVVRYRTGYAVAERPAIVDPYGHALPELAPTIVQTMTPYDAPNYMTCLVGVTDCAAGWASGDSIPSHYPRRGFMVDMECSDYKRRGIAGVAIHKERWFATRELAEACARFMVWALDGCKAVELDALAAEHMGRLT